MTDFDLAEVPLTRSDRITYVDGHVVDEETGEIQLSALEEVRRATHALAIARETITQLALEVETYAVATTTPDERQALADFYWTLRRLTEPLEARRKAIEYAWARAFTAPDSPFYAAKKIALPDGRMVEFVAPAKSYKVDGPTLRKELLALAERGLLTTDEVDKAIAPVVEWKPNHTALNTLVRQRGAEVAEVIAACRTEVEPIAGAGKVTIPEPKAVA